MVSAYASTYPEFEATSGAAVQPAMLAPIVATPYSFSIGVTSHLSLFATYYTP